MGHLMTSSAQPLPETLPPNTINVIKFPTYHFGGGGVTFKPQRGLNSEGDDPYHVILVTAMHLARKDMLDREKDSASGWRELLSIIVKPAWERALHLFYVSNNLSMGPKG